MARAEARLLFGTDPWCAFETIVIGCADGLRVTMPCPVGLSGDLWAVFSFSNSVQRIPTCYQQDL